MWVVGNVDSGGRQWRWAWMRVVGGDDAGETALDVGDCAMCSSNAAVMSAERDDTVTLHDERGGDRDGPRRGRRWLQTTTRATVDSYGENREWHSERVQMATVGSVRWDLR